MTHVNEFIDDILKNSKGECYARFFFLIHRLGAVLQGQFGEWTDQFKLFCTFEGKRYRVTGASRFGDIYLTKDQNREAGYEKRVSLDECSQWSNDFKVNL